MAPLGGQLVPGGSDSQFFCILHYKWSYFSFFVSSEDVAHCSSEESTLQEAQCSLKPQRAFVDFLAEVV